MRAMVPGDTVRIGSSLLLLLFLGAPEPGGPGSPVDRRLAVARSAVVWIGDGWFIRGSGDRELGQAVRLCRRAQRGVGPRASVCVPEAFMDETPRSRVWVSRYGIDRTEVTNAAYRRCVLRGRCAPSRISDAGGSFGGERHPVAGVTFVEAQRYCRFVGGRLPTEAEWERAARGEDGRRFPWGMHDNPRLANHGRATALPPGLEPDDIDGYRFSAPVGSFPDGASPYGLLDMAGNVFEWTSDRYSEDAYTSGERVDPRGAPTGSGRVVRGGSWQFPSFFLRTAGRVQVPETASSADLGFRCAYDPSTPAASPRPS